MAQDFVLKKKKGQGGQRKKEKTTYEKKKKYMLLEARSYRGSHIKKNNKPGNQRYLEERKAVYTF